MNFQANSLEDIAKHFDLLAHNARLNEKQAVSRLLAHRSRSEAIAFETAADFIRHTTLTTGDTNAI